MAATPSAVLFACTYNTVRSPMAEGILKSFKGQYIYVDSVGVCAGEPNGFMIEVMAEVEIDLSNHVPKTFQLLDDRSFDLVISLSPEAQHSAVELTRWMACEVEYWPTLDPTILTGSREIRLNGYRSMRENLFEKIRDRFD